MPLVLIGYRGTGKSTVARLLAERLGEAWLDADVELERVAGKSIRDIFAEEGEAGFRDREQRIVAQLMASGPAILALGGGAVLRAANRQHIRAGQVVWLTAPAATIAARLRDDPTTAARRPPLTAAGGEQEIESLLAARESLYRECADFTVSTASKSPEQIAEEIVCLLRR